MTVVADLAVIGGGIHGCSTALHAARAGLDVIVLEKNWVGRHASGVNAGGVRRLNRHPAEIPLACASLALWQRIGELVGDDCGFVASGQVRVAETEPGLRQLEARAAMVRRLGFAHEEMVDRRELRDLVPALADHCLGGLVCRADGFASPYHSVCAFARQARRQGVRIIEGCRVHGITQHRNVWRLATDREPVEARLVANCGGAWAGEIATRLGEPVPLRVIAPMMLVTSRMPAFCTPVVGSQDRFISFKQVANGTVVIGGGFRGRPDPVRETATLDFAQLAENAATAAGLFPLMAEARIVRCWAGIEAEMPDQIPVIGPSSTSDGVFHAFGFSGHGFQLGPIVGRILVELMTQGTTDLPIAPFAITRFLERRVAHAVA
jgi:sarcosine oxidase subunit beta